MMTNDSTATNSDLQCISFDVGNFTLEFIKQTEKQEPVYAENETPENIYWGMSGEDLALALMKESFDTTYGWYYKHNNLTSVHTYGRGKGMDAILQHKKSGYQNMVATEVKNFNPNQKRSYGTKFVKKEVLPRCRDVEAKIKLLIITSKKLLTKKALTLLNKEGWTVFETEVQLTQELYIKQTEFQKIAKKLSNQIHAKLQELKLFPYNQTYQTITVNQPIKERTLTADEFLKDKQNYHYNYNNTSTKNYDTPMDKKPILRELNIKNKGTPPDFSPYLVRESKR